MSESISPYWDAYKAKHETGAIRDPRPPLSYDTGAAGRKNQAKQNKFKTWASREPFRIVKEVSRHSIGFRGFDNAKHSTATEELRAKKEAQLELARIQSGSAITQPGGAGAS